MAVRVWLIAFEGVQTLDVTGPGEVFGAVRSNGARGYDPRLVAGTPGAICTTSGLRLVADALPKHVAADDIVMIAGGPRRAIEGALTDADLMTWLRDRAPRAGRITSVCTGAFILAETGLLDGRRATTHWEGTDLLAQLHPRIDVDGDAIFVADGPCWTSAGVTTGIDMALAIVELDHGRKVADSIAANLVLYARRPGYQSQFSAALVAQREGAAPLASTIAWARKHLRDVTPDGLARRAGMSRRTLHRRCLEQTGTTPARLIDRLRVESARDLLARTRHPLKTVAAQCGFAATTAMRRAFHQHLGMTPQAYRAIHSVTETR